MESTLLYAIVRMHQNLEIFVSTYDSNMSAVQSPVPTRLTADQLRLLLVQTAITAAWKGTIEELVDMLTLTTISAANTFK